MAPWARRRSVGSGQVHGSVRQLGEAAHASRGVGAPEGPEVQLWALTFSPPGLRHPTRKLARLPRFVRLRVQNPTGLGECQQLEALLNVLERREVVWKAEVLEEIKRLKAGRPQAR